MPKPLTDLCDQYPDQVQVVTPLLRSYGAITAFSGQIATVKVHEDNVLVRAALSEQGHGRVLVVDGGGSLACALLGDQIAALACQNGWAGIIIHGCIRDAREVARLPIGVWALATNPRKSGKQGTGERNSPVSFANATFVPGHFLYADEDGIITAPHQLE